MIPEQCAISVEELAGRLKEECEKYGKKVVLLGDGVPVYREKVQEILQGQCEFCLLYTSDAADEEDSVDLGGRGVIKKKNE